MAVGKLSIGFILSLPVAENVFMGGAMVTDAQGLPLEFRYTEPVRATKLQRVLYGDVLDKYIHSDVIVANLVGRMEHKPDLLVVSDALLLPALDGAGKKAVALTLSAVPPLKEIGAQQESTDTEFFLQVTDKGSPVRVRVVGTSAETAKRTEIARLLTEAGRTMDPLEPLRRVEAAIKMLYEEVPELAAA